MKRWAVVTVALYALALCLVTGPLLVVGFGLGSNSHTPPAELMSWYSVWGAWVWIGVATASQALLLVVPVGMAERRPLARRRLRVPILASAFLFGFMTVPALLSIPIVIWRDKPVNVFGLFGDNSGVWVTALLYVAVSWTAWAIVFSRALARDEPDALIRRLTAWLLRGSILELLVAVPTHVIARRRDDCCAPVVSFWGIAAGITVMLISFGPGAFFLFVARMRAKRPSRS